MITVSSVRPFAGLAVNITPAASAGSIRCTTTASAMSPSPASGCAAR